MFIPLGKPGIYAAWRRFIMSAGCLKKPKMALPLSVIQIRNLPQS
ncbi:hypothetical protein HMPREF9080_00050 [Cardiobacterium valvarum F0432]|uniref:Uncharacterized protein n=1 Tax=Cardiobacterium valvarum F0432 TaxID=797473 RepID=G9ZBC7_9GAMM|nr:hypothetical protein HMPREF9080_00050 [Cardiobacterium valvarum F0432]